jgi:hypothetical protein
MKERTNEHRSSIITPYFLSSHPQNIPRAYNKFSLVTNPYVRVNTVHSPISTVSGIEVRTPCDLFLTSGAASDSVCPDRNTSWLVPKNLLKAKAETVDSLVDVERMPGLMTMVQFECLDLTQKMLERLGTEKRHLWLIRALRARKE